MALPVHLIPVTKAMLDDSVDVSDMLTTWLTMSPEERAALPRSSQSRFPRDEMDFYRIPRWPRRR